MRKVAILTYHRVENLYDDYNMQAVTPSNFEMQMKYLCEHYDILRLEDDPDCWFKGERDGVIITFDDGYYDYYSIALPILERYHIPSAIFIATGNIDSDKENWTDDILKYIFSSEKQQDFLDIQLPFYVGRLYTRSYQEKFNTYYFIRKVFLNASKEEREQYLKELARCTSIREEGRGNRRTMTSQELQAIASNKNVLIGAHTEGHVSLGKLDYVEQEKEIRNSKCKLEKITGRTINCFSYPFGSRDDYSKETINILRKNGFKKAVTTFAKCVEREPLLELPRFWVKNYGLRNFQEFMEKQVFQYYKDEDVEKANIIFVGGLGQDNILRNKKPLLVVWGAGVRGRGLFKELEKIGLSELVQAYGDNCATFWGKQIGGVDVCSLKQIRELQRQKDCHILVTGQYDLEICRQLVQENIANIHLIL